MNRKSTYEELEQRVNVLEQELIKSRQEEKALQRSEKNLAEAQRLTHIGSYEYDVRANKLYWSDEIFCIFGISPGDITPTVEVYFEHIHPDDRRCVEQAVEEAISTRGYREIEYRIIRSDGTERNVLERFEAIYKNGEWVSFIGTNQDITDRKRVDEALRESEAKYRFLTDTMTDIIWITDLNLNVTYISPSIEKFLGFTPEEWMKMPAGDTMTPESFFRTAEVLASELQREQEERVYPERTVKLELEFYRKDSSTVWMELITNPIRDETGRLIGIHGVSRDITERKCIEGKIIEQRNLANKYLQIAGVMMCALNSAGEITLINQKGLTILGYHDEQELLGKNWFDVSLPEKEVAVVRGVFNQLMAGDIESVEYYENPVRTKSDQERIVAFHNALLRDAEDRIIGVLFSGEDITEHKRTEEELQKSREILQAVLNNIPVRVFWKDRNLEYLGCNMPFARDAGFEKAEDIVGKDDYAMGWREQADRYRADDRAVIESGQEKLLIEEPQTTPSGDQILLMTSKVPLRDTGGAITGVLGTYLDITERKTLEAQLIQAQKMESVGRLAGGVAHDFNNMLMAIICNTEMAMEETDASTSLYANLTEIVACAKRSADLTRQLLAFARKQTISPILLDLNDVISTMIKMLQRLIGEHIDLVWKPASNIWRVKMDPSQIDQILVNLAVNARDAITGVGNLTIETENAVFDETDCVTHKEFIPGEFVLLAVSDTGNGMEKETLEHLFEPFFTTKEVGKGTGLGLATIYGIVKQNDGFINVYSEPGQGTTFKIYIPRTQIKEAPETKETGKKPARGTETILFVEDELSILKLGKTILEHYGYKVLDASTPGEALKRSEQHQGSIHLLITDVVMPQMNGRDLWKKIAGSRPEIKTLYMSGYTADVIADHCVLEEGIHFLQKPFSTRALAAKVREVLDETK